MAKKLNSKSKIKVVWTTSVYDYDKQKEKEVIAKFSKKYGVPKENISVLTKFINPETGEDETVSANEAITNINDTEFQKSLFREYAKIKEIENVDFDAIFEIDSRINALIDYDKFEKSGSYSFEWIKWSNFLSYGEDNFIDFNDLKGLILLTSNPANQGGKTNFAVDLPHFIQFGVTGKSDVQADIFNKYNPTCTEVNVECCIKKDGIKYVIKRTLTRPALEKRTAKSKVTSKVQYFRVDGDNYTELSDYDPTNTESENGATVTETNKIIKEAFGRADDFDMIVCATEDNLKEILEKKDTERGRILSRWIGLLPLEEKDVLARETYNKSVKPKLYTAIYDKSDIDQKITDNTLRIKGKREYVETLKNENASIEENIKVLEESEKTLSASKNMVDSNVLKVDINTLTRRMSENSALWKRKDSELKEIVSQIDEIGDIDFSMDKYESVSREITSNESKLAVKKHEYEAFNKQIEALKKGEYCPTCGRKLDNVDNSAKIKENEEAAKKSVEEGRELRAEIEKMKKLLEEMKSDREKFDRKNKYVVKKGAIEVEMEKIKSSILEDRVTKSEYEKNVDAINKNNEIDIKLGTIRENLKAKRTAMTTNVGYISSSETEILNLEKENENYGVILKKIDEDAKIDRDWQIYLDMVGKNGVSKMVLRKVIPVINASLSQMLDEVCDFTVEMSMTDKGEVNFDIVRDGVRANAKSGSGFEKFATAMALRVVLGSMSTLPKLNFIVLDEVLGAVAKVNYENVRNLFDKMLTKFDTIIQVTHNEDIKDWHDKTIVVKKENNISHLEIS